MTADLLISLVLNEATGIGTPGLHDVEDQEPGTRPIPDHHIRMFHYTPYPDSVAHEGIKLNKSRGHTYGDINTIWAVAGNSETHPYKKQYYQPMIEFHIDPRDPRVNMGGVHPSEKWTPEDARDSERSASTYTFNGDIKPEEIVAIHRPWHVHARTILKDPLHKKKFEEGHYEFVKNDPELKGVHEWLTQRFGKK
jgi:hypothetical protein